MSGFVYIWYDRKRKMYYIGSHWGTEDDGYICSSNRMRDAYRRRPQDFKRRIVERVITDRNTLLEIEEKWLKRVKRKQCYYNLRFTTSKSNWTSKGQHLTEEHKQKLRENHWTKNGYTHPFLGKSHSSETRQKISDKLKGISREFTEEHKQKLRENHWSKCESYDISQHPRFGKTLTEETKIKLRSSNVGRVFSIEHRKKLSEAAKTRKSSSRKGIKWSEEAKLRNSEKRLKN